jgi:hypothetical protein
MVPAQKTLYIPRLFLFTSPPPYVPLALICAYLISLIVVANSHLFHLDSILSLFAFSNLIRDCSMAKTPERGVSPSKVSPLSRVTSPKVKFTSRVQESPTSPVKVNYPPHSSSRVFEAVALTCNIDFQTESHQVYCSAAADVDPQDSHEYQIVTRETRPSCRSRQRNGQHPRSAEEDSDQEERRRY